jgi:hypothetical protein
VVGLKHLPTRRPRPWRRNEYLRAEPASPICAGRRALFEPVHSSRRQRAARLEVVAGDLAARTTAFHALMIRLPAITLATRPSRGATTTDKRVAAIALLNEVP